MSTYWNITEACIKSLFSCFSPETSSRAALQAGQCGGNAGLCFQTSSELWCFHSLWSPGCTRRTDSALCCSAGQPGGERNWSQRTVAQAGELRTAGDGPTGLHPEPTEGSEPSGPARPQRGGLQADHWGQQKCQIYRNKSSAVWSHFSHLNSVFQDLKKTLLRAVYI